MNEGNKLDLMFDDLLLQVIKGKLSHADIEAGKRYEEFKQVKGWNVKYGYRFNIYSNDHLIDGKKHFHFDNDATNVHCKLDFDGNVLEQKGDYSIPSNILKELKYFVKKSNVQAKMNEMWNELNAATA